MLTMPVGDGSDTPGDSSPSADAFVRRVGAVAGAPPLHRAARPDVPGCELIREIGQGGMGVVYLAEESMTGRRVAVKVIHEDGPPHWRARFLNEAKAVARLRHPNIVQFYRAGEYTTNDGHPALFIVIEYVPGRSLEERIKHNAPEPRRAAEIVEQVARAVHHAHEEGVVHRDLKPANIVLHEDGTPKVTDFGLAKILAEDDRGQSLTRGWVGTPAYMAPEQKEGRNDAIGARTDVYGLGAVLYEALTGQPPVKPMDGMLLPPGQFVRNLPRDLEAVVLKCLEHDPASRYASAGDLADDLRRWLDGAPTVARPPGPVRRARHWVRRNPRVAAALALAATLLPVLLAWNVSLGREQGRTRTALESLDREQTRTREALERSEGNVSKSNNLVSRMVMRTEAAQRGHLTPGELHALNAADALELFRTYVKEDSKFPLVRLSSGDTHLFIGYVHRSLGQRAEAREAFRSAIRLYERLAEQDPGNPDYHDAVGQGRHILALELNATGLPADVPAHCALAKAAYRRALELDPDHRQTLNHFSWFLAICADPALRDPDEAVRLAERFAALEPNDPRAWHDLGTAHYRRGVKNGNQGDFRAAVEEIGKAIKLRGGTGKAHDLFFLALAHHQLGNHAKAREIHGEAVVRMNQTQPSDSEFFMFNKEAQQIR